MLTTVPCGVGCTAGVAIDLTQGDAISLPRGGPQEPHLAMEFVKDSSLIRMRWAAQSDASGHVTSCGHEDYILTDSGFESQGKGVEPGLVPSVDPRANLWSGPSLDRFNPRRGFSARGFPCSGVRRSVKRPVQTI